MNRPTIGATVSADHRMIRATMYPSATSNERHRIWHRHEKAVHGLYIGYRTVSDGRVDYYPDEGSEYVPEKHFVVWLIVENERHNPVRCLPEDVRIGG